MSSHLHRFFRLSRRGPGSAAAPGHPGQLGRLPRRFIRQQNGQSIVEMAMLLPLFLLLLFAIIQFSIVLYNYGAATYAVCVAARYASLHSSTSLSPCTSTTISGIVSTFVKGSSTTVTTTWASGNVVGGTVNVYVRVSYPTGIPFSTFSKVSIKTSAQQTITR